MPVTDEITTSAHAASLDSSGRVNVVPRARENVKSAVLSFLDAAITSTGTETYYNTREEQINALYIVHEAVFAINRGLYAAMLVLPGLLDISRQIGIEKLLKDQTGSNENSMISWQDEQKIIRYIANDIEPQRLFKLFGTLKTNKVNNRRTRRLILTSILSSNKLEFWAVKYRKKLRTAITHAWGQKTATFVRETISKGITSATNKQKTELKKLIDKFAHADGKLSPENRKKVYQCVCFILDGEKKYNLELLKHYYEARDDLEKGKNLPTEVLEGIRSSFHKDYDHAKVLQLTKHKMSDRSKMLLQKSAKKAGVEINFDPTKQNLVKLYVYALEMGINKKIRDAMDQRAKKVAASIPIRYKNVGIVVDTSASMFGSDKQKNRPLAIALTMRDILSANADNSISLATNGEFDNKGMIKASGETSLANTLVDVVKQEPDVVYMITDGYENAPAGRVNEVIKVMRKINIDTPIYQVTPVMASETLGKIGSTRRLSDDIEPMPVSNPESIGLSMVRAAIGSDLEQGLKGLLNVALPMLEMEI